MAKSIEDLSAIVTMRGTNGIVQFDKRTHIGVKDSKGNVKVFAKNERSGGAVNNRLYGFYNFKRFAEGKRKPAAEKPFVAQVVQPEPNPNKDFVPFVVKK